jgi:hypothetical protein
MIAAMSPQQKGLYGNLYQRYANLTRSSDRTAITAAQCAAGIDRAVHAAKPGSRYRAGIDSKIVCLLVWLLPDRWMDGLMAQSLNREPLPAAKPG